MDLINTAVFAALVVNAILGLILLIHGRGSKISIVYSINILMILWWIAAMIFYRLADPPTAIFRTKILYLSSTFIASSFVYFSHIFPRNRTGFGYKHLFFIFAPNAAIAFLILYGSSIISGVQVKLSSENVIEFGPLFYLFALYIFGYFLYGFFNLYRKYFNSEDAAEKIGIAYLLISYIIATGIAFITNLILPPFGYFEYNWFGQIGTVLMVFFTTYAIFKFRLFNIKVIATEFLTFILWAFLLIRTILSASPQDQIINGVLLVVTILLGIFIIRSVIREVRQREELERLTKKLEAANKELKKLDQLKSDFLSFATHQLRSPLTVIKGYISMIVEGSFGQVSKEALERLKRAYESNDRLIKLVDDFLNLSRIEQGRMKYDFAYSSIEDIVGNVVKELADAAKNKNLSVLWRKPIPPIPQTAMDASKIHEVIYNLVDNAIKYTSSGKIEIKAGKAGGFLRVFVSDTGVGLSAEDINNLFKKFSRGTASREPHLYGNGIGLYVARRIVEAHGGRIWAESEGPGQGSSFYVELPIK